MATVYSFGGPFKPYNVAYLCEQPGSGRGLHASPGINPAYLAGPAPFNGTSTDHIKTIQFIGIYGTYDPENNSLIFNHGQSQASSDTIGTVCVLTL